MALEAPQALDASHRLDEFNCGKPALNDWLTRYARQAQASGSAKTYVIAEDARIAGYFSLTVGQIDTLEAPDRMRKGMAAIRYQWSSWLDSPCRYRIKGVASVLACSRKRFVARLSLPIRRVSGPC